MSSIDPTSATTATTAAAPASSPYAAPPASAGVRDAIVAANVRFITAFRAGDPDGVAACYTPDAQLLPANSDVVTGTAAIAAFWRAVMAMGITDGRLETVEVEARNDLAVETGRYVLAGADGGAVDDGKYLVVWHRDDGGAWRLHRDIWTTSRPAPTATA